MIGSLSYSMAACAVALALGVGVWSAPQPATPVPGEAVFSVFISGKEIGREQVNLSRVGSDWVITSTNRIGPPIDVTVSRFELKYSSDWQPLELKADGRMRPGLIGLATSFGLTTAINEITQNGITSSKNDQISARTVVLPTNFFAAYEGLSARLVGLKPGAELPIYVAPQAEIKLTVRGVTRGQFQTPGGLVITDRYSVTFLNPGWRRPR